MLLRMSDFLLYSYSLFFIAVVGMFINRNNVIVLLLCIELLLLAVNTNFIAFSYYSSNIDGQLVVFFVLAVAAVEAAVGLSILIKVYREKGTIDIKKLNILKG